MGLRRRIALFLGCRVGLSSPFIPEGFGHAHGNQAGRNALVGPKHDGFLYHRAGLMRQ
jgi:hypothetical protein